MALAPHWLDDVFVDTKNCEKDFMNHHKVKAAFAAANAAFMKKASRDKEEPGVPSGSPTSNAGRAFMEALGLQDIPADQD